MHEHPGARSVRCASAKDFGSSAVVYQELFLQQCQTLGLRGRLPFKEYVTVAGHSLQHAEVLANEQVPCRLGALFEQQPASRFFGSSCRRELLRD